LISVLNRFLQVRELWEEFYSNADAVVFMVDSADTQRFDEAKTELHQVLNSDQLRSVPLLVFGNKSDLEVACERFDLCGNSQDFKMLFAGKRESREADRKAWPRQIYGQ
jgi:50S ribosomal subunit-associated GTPase HflX